MMLLLLQEEEEEEEEEEKQQGETTTTPLMEVHHDSSSPEKQLQKEEDGYWEFLPLLTTNSSDNYTHRSFNKNSLTDAKNKGVCTSCVITPLESNKINSKYTIKEKGDTSTRFCIICNDIKPSREMEDAGKCNHYFCVECIKDYLSEILKESGTMQVECPEKDCKKILSSYFHLYFPQELVDRCRVSEIEARVLASQRYVPCPFRDCYGGFVDDMKDYFIRACPKCWRVFCMRCRGECHMGISCNKARFPRRNSRGSTRSFLTEYY